MMYISNWVLCDVLESKWMLPPCSLTDMHILQGYTALHLAALNLWSARVAALADNGANLNAKTHEVSLWSVCICVNMSSAPVLACSLSTVQNVL